ncbi:uncharacterized protein LOC114316225 [Camellia sinensis]|uniref:uncharacterized protein LOC114316225 n=1 Tax=Camellia sinensis TaxID=4442 RepID=UPI001036794A|nr:uncharacterized protein LOC114316225 [Camellia sinensis]
MGSELVSAVVTKWVCGQPLVRPTDVVFDLKNDHGLDISYRVAGLGVKKVRGEVYWDHAMSFNQLRWYNRTFLKGRFKGNLLVATAKDNNQGLFLVAFVIVDFENSANWEWFLRNLKEVVCDGQTLTFISDRHIGLLLSMPNIFPSTHHGYCLFLFQINLRDRMKYVNASHKVGLMRKLRDCAYAPTVACFNEKLDVLKKSSLIIIEDFMKDLHPKHWGNVCFRGQRYREICSNTAESFNNWVRDARYLSITRLVDMIRGKSWSKWRNTEVNAPNGPA